MSLARNSFFTTLTQILIQFFGILSGIIMARMLGPEGRGVYALYFTNAQLVFTFSSFSIGAAIIYFIPAGKISPQKMLGLSFLINAISSLVGLGLILFSYFSPLQSAFFSDNYLNFAFVGWMILYTIAIIISATYTSFFQAIRKFPELNKINLISSIFSLLCFSILFFLKNYIPTRVGLFLLILFISQLVSLSLFAYSLHKRNNIKPSFRFSIKKDFPGLKKFIIAAHLSIVANFFNYRFSTWAINYYLNEAALGWYSLAVNTGAVFSLVTEPLSMVLTPYLSERQGGDKITLFNTYFRIFFWTILLLACAAMVLAPWLIPWVYGQEFQPSVLLFQIAIPGICLASMTKILASFVISNGKQEYNLIATLVGLIITITANLVLVSRWGAQGAVYANIITYAGIFITLLSICFSKLQLRPGNIFSISLSDWKLLKRTILSLFHK
ncbi:MAG: oligosaccharide flippase family protein [Bacteroidales bacterium]